MKWAAFVEKTGGTRFVEGDWNVIDDRSGRKVKASDVGLQWDGMRTTRPQRRHEQDFIRSTPERIRTPWARIDPDDTFVNQFAKVTNGNFITDSGWTKGASWSIDTSKDAATYTAGSTDTLYQSVSALTGKIYEVEFTVFNWVGNGSITPSIGTASGTARTGNGTYKENITSGGTNPDRLTFTPGAGGTSFDLDFVRVLRVG